LKRPEVAPAIFITSNNITRLSGYTTYYQGFNIYYKQIPILILCPRHTRALHNVPFPRRSLGFPLTQISWKCWPASYVFFPQTGDSSLSHYLGNLVRTSLYNHTHLPPTPDVSRRPPICRKPCSRGVPFEHGPAGGRPESIVQGRSTCVPSSTSLCIVELMLSFVTVSMLSWSLDVRCWNHVSSAQLGAAVCRLFRSWMIVRRKRLTCNSGSVVGCLGMLTLGLILSIRAAYNLKVCRFILIACGRRLSCKSCQKFHCLRMLAVALTPSRRASHNL
jgi:hypothetical protein